MSDFFVYILLAVLIFAAYKYLFSKPAVPARFEDEEIEFPPTEKKDMTLDELHKYDGSNPAVKNRIYIAVRGKIHDVTTRPDFYGTGAPYNVMAGHDATYGLARGTLEESDMDIEDPPELTLMERSTLNDWEMLTFQKYPVVGKLLKSERAEEDEEKEETTTGSDSPQAETKDNEEITTAAKQTPKSAEQPVDQPPPCEAFKPSEPKEFSLEELHKYDGENPESPEVFIALKGLVFDVSTNQDFQKGGVYALCAGKDASLCLAKDSIVPVNIDKSLDDVNFAQLQILESWLRDFQVKYNVVGHLSKGAGATADQAEFYLPAPSPPRANPLHEAIGEGDIEKIRELIIGAEDIDRRDERTNLTPLHFAIQERHVEIAKLLVESGASLTEKASLYDEETAIELAKRFDLDSLAEFFDANQRGSAGDEVKEVEEPQVDESTQSTEVDEQKPEEIPQEQAGEPSSQDQVMPAPKSKKRKSRRI